ncbi:hypothetical protein D3C71_989010 [compost metagenome]
MQQEQHDEAAFAEAVRCQPCSAVTVDRAGQGEQLEAQAQRREVCVTTALRFVDEGKVFGFQHTRHPS